jgi:hypothetical protein
VLPSGELNVVDPDADEEQADADEERAMTDAPKTFRPMPNASKEQVRRWEQQMHAWLADQLDEQNCAPHDADKISAERYAVIEARAGRPEMLRQIKPEWADLIQSPPLGPWQKYPKRREVTLTRIAADFARRIRALWQLQYDEKKRRRDEKSAEGFAIDIVREWFDDSAEAAHLKVKHVQAAAKPSGKHKPRRKSRAK